MIEQIKEALALIKQEEHAAITAVYKDIPREDLPNAGCKLSELLNRVGMRLEQVGNVHHPFYLALDELSDAGVICDLSCTTLGWGRTSNAKGEVFFSSTDIEIL